MNSFQQESKHRQELENKYHDLDKFYIKKSTNHSLVGTWLGFGIGIAVLVLAGYFAHLGYPKSGVLIATVYICGLVGTFIYGTKHKDNNRQ